MPKHESQVDPEARRLEEDARRERNWKRWGPYLAARQWGTVREDYSSDGNSWDYFPHEHARSRAYRWGEDGLLGISDRQGRLCFAIALWNERDPFLKERLFGLTNAQGNHGEDVKEEYYFLDNTPTHAYMRALYKYPQRAFPYAELVAESARRSRSDPEYELVDTGAFDEKRYFDVSVEYAKHAPEDLLVRITVTNHGPEAAPIHVLPHVWFRNTWSWGGELEGTTGRPRLRRGDAALVLIDEPTLSPYRLAIEPQSSTESPELLFTENETNVERLFGGKNRTPFVKDAFHEHVVSGKHGGVNPKGVGTKAAWRMKRVLAPGESCTIRLRLFAASAAPVRLFGAEFDASFEERRAECAQFHDALAVPGSTPVERAVARQAYAGLL